MCDFNDGLNRINNLLIYLQDNDLVIFGLVVFLVHLLLAVIILNYFCDENH